MRVLHSYSVFYTESLDEVVGYCQVAIADVYSYLIN